MEESFDNEQISDVSKEDLNKESYGFLEPVTDDYDENDLTSYDIAVFYNTYNLSVLLKWWAEKRLVVPKFQRSFVWSTKKASEFVDTILRGLPAPAMFFYDDREQSRYLVVDGLQRLCSLYFYIKEGKIAGKEFKLVGDIHPDWKGKTFEELTQDQKNRLEDALLNITVMRPLIPEKGSSPMYLAFQRLNTGGVTLNPQEIRMAVSFGPLAEYLDSLSRDPRFDKWLFFRTERQKNNDDYSKIQELILKFWTYYFMFPNFTGGSTRKLIDVFFDEQKRFDEGPNKTGKRYFSKKEFEDAFNAAFDIVIGLSEKDISPYSKPTQTYLEAIWVGLTYRILKQHKEVNIEKLPEYIANWKNVIGKDKFDECFQARRTSSIQSAYERIKAGIDYFSGDF